MFPVVQLSTIGSDNGLTPTRWEAIIWTKGGQIYWRIYTLLGLNELKTLPYWSTFLARVWFDVMLLIKPHLSAIRELCVVDLHTFLFVQNTVVWCINQYVLHSSITETVIVLCSNDCRQHHELPGGRIIRVRTRDQQELPLIVDICYFLQSVTHTQRKAISDAGDNSFSCYHCCCRNLNNNKCGLYGWDSLFSLCSCTNLHGERGYLAGRMLSHWFI